MLFVPLQTFATTLTGKVVKVADGDTITILVGTEQHRIRLQGIDAPERKQPFGKASGRSLSALVAGKQVRVEYGKRDRYGRILGVVWVRSPDARCDAEPCPMTLDAGLYQVTVGMVYVSKQKRGYSPRLRYRAKPVLCAANNREAQKVRL